LDENNIMRAKPFLQYLQAYYNPQTAAFLADTPDIRGGWEVWLQVEIARTFVSLNQNWICERELSYPSGNLFNPYLTYDADDDLAPVGTTSNARYAARCDFFLYRKESISIADETYIELKCINPSVQYPHRDAWTRFKKDVIKIQALQKANKQLNCIALLATSGVFTLDAVGGENPGLAWFWNQDEGRVAYVWDPTQNAVTTLQNVALDGSGRFFIVAVAIT